MCFLCRRGLSLGGTRSVLPNAPLCISENDDIGNMQIKMLFVMMRQSLEIIDYSISKIRRALFKLRRKSIEHTSGKPQTITTELLAFQVQVLK